MESTLELVKTPALNDRLSDHVLNQIITDLTADSPIKTTVRTSGPLDTVSPRFAQHIEAALRESVSNAVRHAKATTLMIAICADSDVVIEVTDDALGMPVTVGRSGLYNLRNRAQTAGGTCTVQSPDEGGTRFIWTAPLP
jgi:signal transduction histidine kinase